MSRRVPENARSAAHYGPGAELIGEAETRREAFLERVDARALAHAVTPRDQDRGRLRIEVGPPIRHFAVRRIEFVTQPDVQSQFPRGSPIIGHIRAVFSAANAHP